MLELFKTLQQQGIYFELKTTRDEALMILADVPGERWEIELFADGHIEIERFLSDGTITDEKTLEHLFSKFGES